mmetsp:Transcript_7268/g.6405  ORF Transcript_7268/g.6405 Transcript_7268/m.6405 type:complete len:209 (-) Transcript_7268:267-893(-)
MIVFLLSLFQLLELEAVYILSFFVLLALDSLVCPLTGVQELVVQVRKYHIRVLINVDVRVKDHQFCHRLYTIWDLPEKAFRVLLVAFGHLLEVLGGLGYHLLRFVQGLDHRRYLTDVLGRSRYDLFQVLNVILETVVEDLFLDLKTTQLWHVFRKIIFNLYLIEVSLLIEHGLVRVVLGIIHGVNHGILGRRQDSHRLVDVVEGQDLL